MPDEIKIGIIGGSGLEDPAFIDDYSTTKVETPYGDPSSALIVGKIGDVPVVIISRHGERHTINPTNVNYRSNIWSLKEQGCTHILATTACGSLKEKIKPGDFVFPDQFIDRTTKRSATFYDDSTVQHVPMGTPFCAITSAVLQDQAEKLSLSFHSTGTVVTIEGPRFSSKAESMIFRSWGCDIINMSTVPEVVLARELGICYQNIAMSTDYDCWHESEEEVSIELVFAVMAKNAETVKKLIKNTIPALLNEDCECRSFYRSINE